MSAVHFRPYADSDREAFGRVRSNTYRGGEPVGADEVLLRPDCEGYVAEQNGQIVAAMTVLRHQMVLGGGTVRSAGIAAVAVEPEHRRGGVGSQMMLQSIEALAQRGYAMATLYAFRESFYRKQGFESVCARRKVTCPMHRLPSLPSELAVRRVPSDDYRAVREAYETYARRYSGMVIRDEEQWRRAAGGDTPFSLFAAGDPVEGYAMVRMDAAFWVDQAVRELVYTSGRAYRSLLGFLGQLGINKTALQWHEPSDTPFGTSYFDHAVEIVRERPLMGRVLNVQQCLGCLQPSAAGGIRLRVDDPVLSSVDGTWQIDFEPDLVRVERSSGEPDLACDVRAFTQMVMGEPSLRDLAFQGRVEGSAAALRTAEGLFTARRAHCMDYF